MNSMIAVSGSTSTPMFSVAVPCGSHGIDILIGSSASCSPLPMTLQKMTCAKMNESAMAPIAIKWLNRSRPRVNSEMTKNASSGSSGISQTR